MPYLCSKLQYMAMLKLTKINKKFVKKASQKIVVHHSVSVYNIGVMVLYMLIGKERMNQEIWFHKYKILKLLGRGGTAAVYLAEHIILKSYRAIKVISKNHPLYNLQRNEAFILKNLKHSCIPIIYDIEENEEGSYIVEQYLEGQTLREYVESNGTVPEDILIHYGLQTCDLIQYLHSVPRPVLYVDLKPDNLIVSGNTLKLIDFGSALYRDEPEEEREYTATYGYAAPELYRRGRINERCDVYGIGILLYYMATGHAVRKEHTGSGHIDQAGGCSAQLKSIINKCLRYYPSRRYATVERLNRELSALSKRNQLQYETKQTVTIAIAGTQPRIGVTHFAFRTCRYFSGNKKACLYEEKNDSGCVISIKNCYEEAPVKDGIVILNGIHMRGLGQEVQPDCRGYRALVRDYGCLTKNNMSDFLSCDIKLLIMGAKDWELEQSEGVMKMAAEYKDICYLFNYLNGRQFQAVLRSMKHMLCYRIPYEPDPYNEITGKNGSELFEELFGQAGCDRRRKTAGSRKETDYET